MNTTPTLVQVDFPFPGPFGAEMEARLKDLALSIIQEPGCLWKIWTENPQDKEAGGIYLFSDRPSAEAYVQMHSSRLRQWGVTDVRAKMFDINQGLTLLTHGPIAF